MVTAQIHAKSPRTVEMTRLLKMFCLTVLALCVLGGVGCVKYKQIVTVMPDGSGKVQYIVGFNRQLAEEGEDPLAEFTAEGLGERSEGIVVYSEPTRYQEGGWNYLAITGYFTDINQVAIAGPDNGGDPVRFIYEAKGEGSTLTIRGGVVLGIAGDFEPVEPEDRGELENELMAGFEVVERFVLPGEVGQVEGARVVADQASAAEMWINVAALIEQDGALSKLKGKEQVVLTSGPSRVTPEQVEDFKAELAKALEAREMRQRGE